MSTFLFQYWTLDIYIGLYSEFVLIAVQTEVLFSNNSKVSLILDIHVGLYKVNVYFAISVFDIGHQHRFVQGMSNLLFHNLFFYLFICGFRLVVVCLLSSFLLLYLVIFYFLFVFFMICFGYQQSYSIV